MILKKKMRDSGQRMNLVILSEGAIDKNGKPITANQVKDVSCKINCYFDNWLVIRRITASIINNNNKNNNVMDKIGASDMAS